LHQLAAFAGFASYVLMVGTIVWGIATAMGVTRRNIARETVVRTHISLGVGALAFLATHIVANVVAPAGGLSWWSATVPYAGTGTAISLGVLGTELDLVVAASTWFRRRFSHHAWHRVHLLAYPAYGLSITHVVVAGSDVRQPVLAALLAVTAVVVVLASLVRGAPALSAPARSAPARSARAHHPGRARSAAASTPGTLTIRVDVDHAHCGRFAVCQQEAPEVFQLSRDGRLRFERRPEARHRDAVRQAARMCPMQAISIDERA
jgi:ferredoxin/DMSO/TMAO reductase YedYZ heme-binding membrane subunit